MDSKVLGPHNCLSDPFILLDGMSSEYFADKPLPGPFIRIFDEDKCLGLDVSCLVISSCTLSTSLKDDFATLAAFLFGQLGVSILNKWTITFSLFWKGRSPTTFFPNVSSGFGGKPIRNS